VNILISTTIGLVGNESSKTQLVCIVGLLYNLPSIVQAIGRIRTMRRTHHSSVAIFTSIGKKNMIHNIDDDLHFKELVGCGLMKTENYKQYTQCMTVNSVYDWLVNDVGCRLVSLATRLGYQQNKCNICDRCCKNPINDFAQRRKKQILIFERRKQLALKLVDRLRRICILCNTSSCTGTCIIKDNRRMTCFHCLGNHQAKNCPREFQRVLRNKACYSCFMNNYTNESIHTYQTCTREGGLKERLRGLIFYDYKKKQEKNCKLKFTEFLSGIYANENTFFTFLYKYSNRRT